MKKPKKKPLKTNDPTDIVVAWRSHVAAFLFLAVAICAAYFDSLHGIWALDDTSIGQYASIESALHLRMGYRVVTSASFLINRLIDPLDPFNYRVVNLVIHFFNSVLVYCLAFMTLGLPGWKERFGEYRFPVALMSSAIFALHPININAVAYIIQRMASLAAMFTLLALVSYIMCRTSRTRRESYIFGLLTTIFVCLGILSKENAVMAVPLIFLYDYIFLARFEKKGFLKKIGTAAAIGLLFFAVSSILFHFDKSIFRLAGTFLRPNQPIVPDDWMAQDVYWTPFQHILTEFRVVARYVFLLFVPLPRLLVFDWWGFAPSHSFTEPLSTLFSFVFIVAAIVFSLYKMKKLPFLSFGILWYFIAISLESFLIVGLDLYFEHRNYLPLAGLAAGTTAQLMAAFKEGTFSNRFVWAIVLLVSIPLGTLTYQRNHVWQDSVTLWRDTVEKAPGNLRAIIALGNAYLQNGDISSAKPYYESAVSASAAEGRANFFLDSVYTLGMTDLFTGDLPGAKRAIALMDARIAGSYRSNILKGFYQSLAGDQDEAIKEFTTALPQTAARDRTIAYTLLGDAYQKKQMLDKALKSYKNAVAVDPSFAAAYHGMGIAYLKTGDINRATYYVGKALILDPNNPLALTDMSDIMLIRKEPPERALAYAEKAVSKSPRFYQPYLAVANILVVMGRDGEAERFFDKARANGLGDYMVPFSKARAYYMKGDREKARELLREAAAMKDTPENIRKMIDKSLAGSAAQRQ
jgi:protein O-mannosyl-transferase